MRLQIHPQFKLNNQSFLHQKDLLDYVKHHFPDDFIFLTELLETTTTIKVNTSGSTGAPKIISLALNALLKSAEATGQYFDLKPQTRALHCLSSDFIAGKMMWVRALHLGWHLTRVMPSSNPLDEVKGQFDFTAMVPLQAQSSYDQLESVKILIIGGAPLSAVWEQKLAKLSTKVYLTYGMTETITHIAVKQLGQTDRFEILPQVQISQDDRGCLEIVVPYISNAKLVTNDAVDLIDYKHFKWLGRFDHVINSGGIKLFPEQIEQQLQPFIKKPFMVSSIQDEVLGNKMILVIASKPYDIDLAKLSQNADLEPYHRPKRVFFINDLPKTENGKIKRSDILIEINR